MGKEYKSSSFGTNSRFVTRKLATRGSI